uniref:Uncharacterized protein n=1 Tax=Setaria viridis TaxID=4556 RepID=A0A4U6TA53_SETVI|nr:hypothetical protein SEVIR_9G511650v2 [Setaria viridis]
MASRWWPSDPVPLPWFLVTMLVMYSCARMRVENNSDCFSFSVIGPELTIYGGFFRMVWRDH